MPALRRDFDMRQSQPRRWTLLACSIAPLSFWLSSAPADANYEMKRADVASAQAAPEIDGLLEPGEWDGATVIRDLHQVSPVEFSSPSEETTWYVMYDSTALYVAAIAHETEPGRITAKTLRQGGSLNADDIVTVLVDAFNNKRSGYAFSVNPFGVREDGIYTSGTRLSDDWDGIWQAEAAITNDGWTAELAIPFNTLTFDPENETWGFNLSREIRRKNEEIAWTSRNGRINPTVSGELRGFSGLDQGKGLDIIPSVSATSLQRHLDDSDNAELRPSLDINYKLTPAINLLLTLNTDFAATEVDGRQLDVSRFSLFFPEKRSFFLTDFDIFQFGGISARGGGGGGGGGGGAIPGAAAGTNGMAFYSRRIGLGASREPVDLLGGLKLSGRIGRTDFGTLYVRQDEFEDIAASDLFVGRATHGVLEESSIGAIFTSGDPTSNESSSLVGVDFNFRNTRLPGNRNLESWLWVQKSNNEGLDGDDMAWSVAIGMPAREGWEFGGQVHEAQANYDPRLGFANRTGVRMVSGRISRRWINDNSYWFQRISPRVFFDRWEYLDTGLVQSQRVSVNLIDIRTASNDNIRIGFTSQKERLLTDENPLDRLDIELSPGEYSFDRWNLELGTGDHRAISAELRLEGGDYFDGERLRIAPELNWRLNNHLAFRLEYDHNRYDFPGASATTRQMTVENEIAFNANWSLLTLAQYDNLSDNIGINARLHYNRAAGRDFWLVLNHNMQRFDPDDPEYLDGDFHNVETLVALKFRYTFRL